VTAAVAALRPLVDVLGRLHEAGFVHRDIKAANVFFTPSNGLLLGDAGLVFHPDDTTLSSVGEKRGTSYFMPPEAVDSPDEPKTTWDIYSVAKLLWCLIAGKRVLPEMHRSRGYDLQEQFADQTLGSVNTLLDECLASHPDDRRITDAPLLLERMDDLIAAGATAHEKPALRRHASVLDVRTSAPTDSRIVVRECSYKVTYRGPGLWRFSWRLTVGNLTTEALRLTGRVHLSDADDYRVASDSLPDTTAAAETVVTMHGIAAVSVPGAATITAIAHEIDLQAAPEPWPTRESLGQDQRRVLQHLASNPRQSFTLAELGKSLNYPREVIEDVLRRLDDLRLLEARHDDALGTRYSLSALGRAVGST
jgi:serine/threonine protein kinase